jgi:intracellular multiplication protein IcmL
LRGISSIRAENRLLFTLVQYVIPFMALAVVALSVLCASRGGVRYFGITPDLRVVELAPLDEPAIRPQALLNWTAEVVTGAMSLDFLHWRRQLNDGRGDFDPEGVASFVKSLGDGGHISRIESQRLSLSAVPDGAPVVVKQGVEGGRMTWKVEMPVVVSYQTSSGVAAVQRLLAEVSVGWVDPSVNPKGVAVRQLILARSEKSVTGP